MALLICSLRKPNFFLFQKNSVDPQGLFSCKLIDKKQAQLRNRRELMGATKAASQKQSMFHRVSKANAFSIVMGIYLAFNTRIVQLGPNWDGPLWEIHPLAAILKIMSLLALLYVLAMKIEENGYKKWQALLWLVPLLGPVYVLYLAFSNNFTGNK